MTLEKLSEALGDRKIIHDIVGNKLVVSHTKTAMIIGDFPDATKMSQQAMMAAREAGSVKLAPSSTGNEMHFVEIKD